LPQAGGWRNASPLRGHRHSWTGRPQVVNGMMSPVAHLKNNEDEFIFIDEQ
jgi:hypothetical protein